VSVVASPWLKLLEGAELAHLSVEPPRAGRNEQFPDDLDPRVASALVAQGITGLYTHQAETWEALRGGGNAIVTTSTASGKSLAFNLPVLDLLAREPKSRALYL
jgi:DEAD/DEAH box helicase domain-containing protein